MATVRTKCNSIQNIFSKLSSFPVCNGIFCLSVAVSWSRKNTYNFVTVSSLLILLSRKNVENKIMNAMSSHDFCFHIQQKAKIETLVWSRILQQKNSLCHTYN